MSIEDDDDFNLPNELQGEILKHVPLLPLTVLARSKELQEKVYEELWSRFHFWTSQWHLPSDKVIGMMQSTGTILSGSAALEMALPGSAPPNDLDFYCPRGQLTSVLTFFVHHQEYVDVTEGTGECDPYGDLWVGIKAVHRMQHTSHPSRTINVIESTTPSPIVPVLFFHSTVVMNFVSSDGLMMLYPTLTSKKRGLINKVALKVYQQTFEGLVKYFKRGFDLQEVCTTDWSHGFGRFECADAARRWNDGHPCALAFRPGRQVSISVPVRWTVGKWGRPTCVWVLEGDRWKHLMAAE